MIKLLLYLGSIIIIVAIVSASFLLELLFTFKTWTPGDIALTILDIIGMFVCGGVIAFGIMLLGIGLKD